MRNLDEALQHAISSFRFALASLPANARTIGLAEFPRGSCGDASDLLGLFLAERGFGQWQWIGAERYDRRYCSHAWIERDEFIVDITSSQFAEVRQEIVISRFSPWHAGWLIVSRRAPNIADSPDAGKLGCILTLVRARVV